MHSSIDYGHGIVAVDSGFVRPMLDAVHLVVEGDHAAVVDTGSNDSVPHVLAALAARGLSAAQVDWVMLTHVHLDHDLCAEMIMVRGTASENTLAPSIISNVVTSRRRNGRRNVSSRSRILMRLPACRPGRAVTPSITCASG